VIVRLIKGIEAFSVFIGYIGAWVMAPLIASMVYEVLARHLFNAPTFWAYEVAYMLAGTCYLFGMAYCMKMKGHVRVDFLYDQIGPKWRAIIDIVGYVALMLPGVIWLTYGLYEYAIEAYVANELSGESAWNPVIWPFRAIWVVAFVALVLQSIAEVLKSLLVLFGKAEEEVIDHHGAEV
jgi:TRAP-type mannitol/chloroaromatic compound transport system permease small subunit